MNKKFFLSAKKNFLIILFFFWILFNSQNIFAENNKELDKKLDEIKSEIKKLKIWKNICTDLPKKEIEKSAYKPTENTLNSFNEVFFKEKYQISENWINARDNFLEETSIWWFQQIVDSFTIQFSWNYCFQRDLQKIDKLLYSSIQHWAKLAEKCYDTNWIKKIILETKLLKKQFESSSKFSDEDLYWTYPINCQEDSITSAMKKIDEFKKKIKDLTEWEWAFFDNFSFDIDYEQIEKEAKIEAENYVERNLNNTFWSIIQLLWLWSWPPQSVKIAVNKTITKTAEVVINIKKNINKNKENINSTVLTQWWDINSFLSENQKNTNMSKYANTATKFFEKNSIFNVLEENATKEIIINIKWLEHEIVKTNWNEKELEEFLEKSPENKDSKTLKNFISNFTDFLNKHNTNIWTVESKWILNYWWESDYN